MIAKNGDLKTNREKDLCFIFLLTRTTKEERKRSDGESD